MIRWPGVLVKKFGSLDLENAKIAPRGGAIMQKNGEAHRGSSRSSLPSNGLGQEAKGVYCAAIGQMIVQEAAE
jgi:hypothetical protein